MHLKLEHEIESHNYNYEVMYDVCGTSANGGGSTYVEGGIGGLGQWFGANHYDESRIGGCGSIPIDYNRKIHLHITTNPASTLYLTARGYRRIGTNS